MAHRPNITLIQLEDLLSNALEDTVNVPDELVIPLLEVIDLIRACRIANDTDRPPHVHTRCLDLDDSPKPKNRVLH